MFKKGELAFDYEGPREAGKKNVFKKPVACCLKEIMPKLVFCLCSASEHLDVISRFCRTIVLQVKLFSVFLFKH